ncbi:hypothetical protein ACPRNU_23850 [Chromobacterium vaccinii]|uniref:hypothetical protein n=1 Tax=Chromobacterium vaccinii TaxID=1108595 RepID=UPI003C7487DC
MHSVKFLKHWNKYNPGEVAGFQEEDRELLERLAQAGIIGPAEEPSTEPADKSSKKS